LTPTAKTTATESSHDDAMVEIVRGRIEGLGPVTEAKLAEPLGVAPERVAPALLVLQREGFAMRGRFTPGINCDEWCDRRLLARIHHYTIRRLRAEIEPVATKDFLRFLLAWQRVTKDTRLEGPDSVAVATAFLEGFEAAAGAWETEILPARIEEYEHSWLDDQCLGGHIVWARLTPAQGAGSGERGPSPVRTTPITLMTRRYAPHWMALPGRDSPATPSRRAEKVLDCLRQNGASFFDELVETSGLLRPQVEAALGELVAFGLVTSDGFGGLRALLVPADRRQSIAGAKHRRRIQPFGMDGAGRWALIRHVPDAIDTQAKAAAVEHVARTLLRRYGVVFWRLLAREAEWLPPWRDLLRVYRRLEARGEIRGGRFVAGFAGEQYALPEAVGLLRETRRQQPSGEWISLSGVDPLNLVGILMPGQRLPALRRNRIVYRDGIPIATLAAGKLEFLTELDATTEWQVRKIIIRSPTPAALTDINPG
jgi:ATP-dependent Lhr-like helicase